MILLGFFMKSKNPIKQSKKEKKSQPRQPESWKMWSSLFYYIDATGRERVRGWKACANEEATNTNGWLNLTNSAGFMYQPTKCLTHSGASHFMDSVGSISGKWW